MDYLINEEISPNWNRCNYHQIHQFKLEFFQLTDAKEFYHAYYQQIDDGSLPKLQTILRCQRITVVLFLRPIPPSLDVTDIRIKIGSEICFWDTMVQFNQTPPIITLSPLHRIMRIPECSYLENLNWNPDVDIRQGQIDLDQIFWLRDLPWTGVGVSGGFLVSSLCGTVNSEQDIDLYVFDFDILGNLIQHFVRAVPDLQIYAPKTYEHGFSILTLKSQGQRPLQNHLFWLSGMSSVVRSFDLSHLKIWLDENGLQAEVTSLKELLLGYSRLLRRDMKTRERIKKYTQRGWFIFGEDRISSKSHQPLMQVWN